MQNKNIIQETNFKNLGQKKRGKVRDVYVQDNKVILISTDRHSSFDRIIANIPHKGEVLTKVSNWWFEKTKDIIPNHIIATPDPRVVVAKKYEVIPVEAVVRGFITGTTETSIWTHYQNGKRDFGNFILSDGLQKNTKLEKPVFTPSTKEEHDRTLSPQEMVSEGIIEKELLDRVEKIALEIFTRGQEVAGEKGLILVDTKYEFGLAENGDIVLIDEIHTPDSSRYWYKNSYLERFKKGEEPEYFDKEFLRIWFRENSSPYTDETLPEAPEEMIAELSRRYIEICELITGEKFEKSQGSGIEERIENNLKEYKV